MTHDDELTASSLKDILTKKFGAENVKYGIRTMLGYRMNLDGHSHQLFTRNLRNTLNIPF